MIETWCPEGDPVDSVLVEGEALPGFSEPFGADAKRKILMQSGPGFSGARYLFQGLDISEFSIYIHLQDDYDYLDYQAFLTRGNGDFLRLPQPQAGGMMAAQKAVLRPWRIYHPFLAPLGITHVIVLNVKQPVAEGPGAWMIEVPVARYTPLKRTSAKYEDTAAPKPDDRDLKNLTLERKNEGKMATLANLRSQPLPAPK
jgi:hypothetical protein